MAPAGSDGLECAEPNLGDRASLLVDVASIFRATIDVKRQNLATVCCVVMCLVGCGTMPQTADEFRTAISGASLGRIEKLEVNRSVREVALTFQQKAPECFNVSVRTVSHSLTRPHNSLIEYRATVLPGVTRAELHLQQLHKINTIYPSKPPEGGAYLVVVDAVALAGNRTQLQIFGPSIGMRDVYRTIKDWAAGKDVACPDMANPGL
jgi:hypothetical protein